MLGEQPSADGVGESAAGLVQAGAMRGFVVILAVLAGFGVQRLPLRAARVNVFHFPVDAGPAVLALGLDDLRQLAHGEQP